MIVETVATNKTKLDGTLAKERQLEQP